MNLFAIFCENEKYLKVFGMKYRKNVSKPKKYEKTPPVYSIV